MNRYLNKALVGVAISGALVLTGSALAQPAGQPAAQQTGPLKRCFYARDWQGWHAPNEHMMYVRVNMHQIYRVDFASSCQALTWPDAHLITTFRGSDSVCTPLDLDIKVSDSPHGIPEPCIASGLSELTPEEIAAIPKKDLP
jgi:hypothetical protein